MFSPASLARTGGKGENPEEKKAIAESVDDAKSFGKSK